MKEFRPTYLCIKQHNLTGLKYFCKTTKSYEEMIKYAGSGDYWRLHIKKYGTKYVDTLWYCLFYDKDEIKKFALMCSEQWNIVESKEWANIKLEDGLWGGSRKGHNGSKDKKRGPQSAEHKATLSKIRKGRTPWNKGISLSPEQKRNMRGTQSEEHRQSLRKPKGKQKNPETPISCPHCPKEGRASLMKRWHFDNCKIKKELI